MPHSLSDDAPRTPQHAPEPGTLAAPRSAFSARPLLAALFSAPCAFFAPLLLWLAGMPSGRVGADLDDMFEAADEA
eukprot:6116988-Prymnesium_polylepis.1